MARLQAHELAFAFQSIIEKRLKSLRVSRATTVSQEIAVELMRDVPSEAFEMLPAWERGVIYLHGDITEEYVLAIQEELHAVHYNIKSGIPMTLYLSSVGGACDSGLALFSTIQELRRLGRTVNCHIQGVAMSMGSIVAQACDVRTIEPFAAMMIHEVSDTLSGKTSEVEDQLAFQKRWESIQNGLYAARSGKPIEYWTQRMQRRDVYLTAREAVAEKLADRIKPIPPYPGKRPRTVTVK